MGKRIIALIVLLWASSAWGMLPGFHKVPVSGGGTAFYDAQVTFADVSQTGSNWKACIYDASNSNALVECSSPGTVSRGSTQTALFSGTIDPVLGHSYYMAYVANGYTTLSTTSSGGLYYMSSSYTTPASTYSPTWTANATLMLHVRNSNGDTLLGTLSGASTTKLLNGNSLYSNAAGAL